MDRHFIHFNRRDIRLRFPADPADPWFSELQGEADGFDRPRFHVTRADSGAATQIGAGDTIWLVGQLYAPWGERFPPSLDARIDVTERQTRPGGPGYRYAAADTSQWFALSEATDRLRSLRCVSAGPDPSRLWKDPARPIGHYLRKLREVANPEVLEEWEMQQQGQPLHFVSYRIHDGTRCAFRCARSLFDEGKRVFWDRWCLPRRLAERREAVGDQPLDDALLAAIEQAEVVWGIESALYAAPGSYSAREQAMAQTLSKYRACVLPSS
jgi:hypothetical protein